MKLLLTLTSLAAFIGMAVPAHADSTDDAFISALNAAGITYSDPDAAVGAGKWVCDKVNGGTDMSDVVKTLTSKNASLTPDKAAKLVPLAVRLVPLAVRLVPLAARLAVPLAARLAVSLPVRLSVPLAVPLGAP